jgi:hypothetical protein
MGSFVVLCQLCVPRSLFLRLVWYFKLKASGSSTSGYLLANFIKVARNPLCLCRVKPEPKVLLHFEPGGVGNNLQRCLLLHQHRHGFYASSPHGELGYCVDEVIGIFLLNVFRWIFYTPKSLVGFGI